jgi:putative tryptophan/tyrosine transport system substrate-binding protein
MRRRDIIALLGGAAAAASPLPLLAQQAGRTVRVGMLETVSTALKPDDLAAFRQGLRALGYVEGQNLRIEYRSADGRPERFPALAQELIGLNVDVITTRAIGITSQLFDVRKTADLAPAFENASRQQVGAFVVNIDAVTQENQKLIIELAAQHRLPAIYPSREFVNAGG